MANHEFRDDDVLKNKELIGKFFKDQREKNIAFLIRYFKATREDAEDVVQDSCIALYKNVINGKYDATGCRLSTYLTKICYNQMCKKLKIRRPVESIDNIKYDQTKIDALICDECDQIPMDRQVVLEHVLKNLPDPCGKIIWLFYYYNLSIAEIATLV